MTTDLVPYSRTGTLIYQVREGDDPEWVSNDTFYADLVIDWMESSQRASRLLLLREIGGQGRKFTMLLPDLLEMIRSSVITHGQVSGHWRVKRTGTKYNYYTLMKVPQ